MGATPATTRAARGLRQSIHDHLGSRDVARVIYGSVIGLALVLALQDHPPPAMEVAAELFGAAVAVGLAELYSEIISFQLRTRRRLRPADWRHHAIEAGAVVVGAGFPAIYFVLAALGAMRLDTAFVLSKWTGVGLICAYGFVAGRLSGFGTRRSLAHSAAVGLIGGALVALKAVLH